MSTKRSRLIDLLDNRSFVRWVNGNADSQEKAYWDRWLRESHENEQLLNNARKLLSLPFQTVDISSEQVSSKLNSINRKIDTQDTMRARRFHTHRDSGLNRHSRKYVYAYAAAAVVALLIGVLGIYYSRNTPVKVKSIAFDSIHVPYGKYEVLKLADGSEIMLNANSKLRYPSKREPGKPLDVWLDGEAYFSIIHNPGGKQRLFRVHTNNGIIRDLGTKFVVNTRHHITKVVLIKGAVEVSKDKSPKNNRYYIRMSPGEMANITTSGKSIQLLKVNTEVYSAWIHHKLVFDNTTVKQSIQSIEEYYGVKIQIQDPEILSQRISGTIKNTDLNVALKGLSELLGVKVIHKKNIILLTK